MYTIVHQLLYSRFHPREGEFESPFDIALREASEEELRIAKETLDTGRGNYGYAGKRWRFINYQLRTFANAPRDAESTRQG